MVFHVLNPGVGRMRILRAEKDYNAFQRVVEETLRVAPIRICAYCWLSNHFVLWPEKNGDLSRFMRTHGEHAQPTLARGKVVCGLRALVPRAVQVVSC